MKPASLWDAKIPKEFRDIGERMGIENSPR
jgi:hypothetical protein